MAFKLIVPTVETGCEAEIAVFQNNLESLALRHTDYATFNKESITAPCNYDKLCIINPEKSSDSPGATTSDPVFGDGGSFVINQYASQEVREKNVFLVEGKEVLPLARIDTIRVAQSICAIRTAGKFDLSFRGGGKTVTIESG